MSNPNDRQVGGAHYSSEYQVWDFVMDCNLNYLQGNAVKYIARAHKKNGTEDLEKALHYLEKLAQGGYAIVIFSGQSQHLEKFVKANGLDKHQENAISAIIDGFWKRASVSVTKLIQASQ